MPEELNTSKGQKLAHNPISLLKMDAPSDVLCVTHSLTRIRICETSARDDVGLKCYQFRDDALTPHA